jgi:two-component system sensor histidine kinase UhpB
VSPQLRVLIVEDSPDDAELICRELRRGGYALSVERVYTAEKMTEALGQRTWDLVISDHSMPTFNAPQALRILQGSGLDLPFIILSGSIDEEIAVSAMKAGAHDFITKDRLTRLVPAIERELREAETRRLRHAAERALSEAESRYEDLYENAPDMCASVDAATAQIVQCNRTAERITGFAKAELVGRTLVELYPVSQREAVEKIWSEFQATGDIRDVELQLLRKDGAVIDISLNMTAVRDEQGRILRSRSVWRDISRRKRAERQLQDQAERLQVLSHRLLDIQESERRAVARELHDEIGQVLTAVKLNLQTLGPAAGGAANLRDSIEFVEHAIRLVRDRAMDLRPALLDDFGLVPAIRWYLERHAARREFTVELRADPDMARPPAPLETACFRVIQEAVTNALRHAKAKHLRIEIEPQERSFVFAIHDDGVGFDVAAAKRRALTGGSIGLTGMQERVEFLGGQLDIESAGGHGTHIRVSLPLTCAAQEA